MILIVNISVMIDTIIQDNFIKTVRLGECLLQMRNVACSISKQRVFLVIKRLQPPLMVVLRELRMETNGLPNAKLLPSATTPTVHSEGTQDGKVQDTGLR